MKSRDQHQVSIHKFTISKIFLYKHFCLIPVIYSSRKQNKTKIDFQSLNIRISFCAAESAENYAKGDYAKGSLKVGAS